MSQPWALTAVSYLYQRGLVNKDENLKLVQSVIRLQYKIEETEMSKIKGIIWKLGGYNIVQCEIIGNDFLSPFYSTTRFLVVCC